MGSIDPPLPPIAPIPRPTTLLSLRTGKLKPLGALGLTSGIIKSPRTGRIRVSKLGLSDDEHDLTFHGGVDKAIHQYCVDHYPLWQQMYEEDERVRDGFVAGGFGENLVAGGWFEGNVCVGDVVRIGKGIRGRSDVGSEDSDEDSDEDEAVLLEVSLPRQPCFKLNQRFGIKGFAGKTHQLNRTGWYYRVLREGYIEEGMEIRVMERRHPRWTIAQLHQYVHRDTENVLVMEELVTIPEMGKECKGVFEGRLKKIKEPKVEKKEVWSPYRVVEKGAETSRIVRLVLEAVEQSSEPEGVSPGSHVRLRLPNDLTRAYSVVWGNTNRFTLGIAREENSRGGSTFIHDVLKMQDTVSVGKITESVPIEGSASHHIFVAGGIGITASLAAIELSEKINFSWELHYAVRSAEDVAFKSFLQPLGGKVRVYDKSKGERMDLKGILRDRKWNSHVYVCGPQRMMDAVVMTANEVGMPSEEVHYEAFSVATSGDPFTAEVVGREGVLQVGEEQTLLEILKKAGLEVQSSCEVGNCGTCRVKVCNGKVEHRGSALAEAEKEHEMLSCVSRGNGHIIIELEA